MNGHIPSFEGRFTVQTEKNKNRAGKTVRSRWLVYTTHDGFVGAVPIAELARKGWQQMYAEAKAQADAKRARCVYEQQLAALQELSAAPQPWARCDKPAPVAHIEFAPKPEKLSDSALFEEVERRGFEIHIP